ARAPVEASTAPVALQLRGPKVTSMRTGANDFKLRAHRLAARASTLRRCSPRVVPVFPPTGATGVGSFRPTFGPSRLTRTTWACGSALADSATAVEATRARRRERGK